ncbi:cardiolipin synthase ClsB [Niveibacterium sp. SC-1]|uniref:cardiolipin synthase ClsB n=1 Tax=Niveibacterium sp. SC-1 TaxID=3135646 RepID=UPI00311D55F9
MPLRFYAGNEVELLESGAGYFPALIAAIDDAQREIHLQTYIFTRDATGAEVIRALVRAAQRGVKVCVMVDGFGGRDFEQTIAPELLAAGAQVLIYRREAGGLKFRRHRLRRLHRKVTVVDRSLAFVGGINIIDDLNNPTPMQPRFDYAVRVRGPVLAPIVVSTLRIWWLLAWASLKARPSWREIDPADFVRAGAVRAAFVVRDNLRNRRAIEEAYLDAIGGAREEILLACAYFLPGRRFRTALERAAERGVKVTLLLQGRVEYRILHYATRALYERLLEKGVRIFEYQASFLHAKVGVIDGDWATVGSSNIDPFSLLLSREANLVVRDQAFAARLRQSLQAAMQVDARELLHADWLRSSRWERWISALAYGFLRRAMGLLGLDRRDVGTQ